MAKKKSTFSLDKYKTHDGERGSPEKWREAIRVLLLEKGVDPEEIEALQAASREEVERKLITLGIRRIQI